MKIQTDACREYLITPGSSLFKTALWMGMLFLSALPGALHAQINDIEITRDPRLDTLEARYAQVQRKKAAVEGFRIQVSANSNRNSVFQSKSEFQALFSDIKQYVIYQAPNFKLRVGNYRTRLEAYRDLQRIQQKFNGAFIIRDEIKIEEF